MPQTSGSPALTWATATPGQTDTAIIVPTTPWIAVFIHAHDNAGTDRPPGPRQTALRAAGAIVGARVTYARRMLAGAVNVF
jgi:hypothetical protein